MNDSLSVVSFLLPPVITIVIFATALFCLAKWDARATRRAVLRKTERQPSRSAE